MEIVKLTAKDYDEWLHVLNTAFGEKRGTKMDFEKDLPKMCIRDDYHVGMHIAVRENGKICSLLGVYPIKVKIGGTELMFSTVGNVATLAEYEGKGYMTLLLDKAMEELEKIGADASRLGGSRQRYNRYGYEASGTVYNFEIYDSTTKYCAEDVSAEFKPISKDSAEELAFINNLRSTKIFHVERSRDNICLGDYLSLCAWGNIPYVALNSRGEMIGYVSASPDNTELADVMATSLDNLKTILFSWQKKYGGILKFTLMATESEAVKYFASVAHSMSINSPSHFKIINFHKIADALIKVKADITPDLPQGEFVLGIEDWGNLKICVENGNACCEKTNETPQLTLDKLAATRFLFGPASPDIVAPLNSFLASVLPLPLTWNTLDRV